MKFSLLLFLFAISFNNVFSQVNLLTLNKLDLRLEQGKDTVYVVNFWATWCAPCVKELPNFEKLNADYKNQPLKVILLSLDFKSKLEKVVEPFVVKKGLKSEVFLLNEKSEQEYINRISKEWSGALPATLIINPKKKTRKFYEQEFTFEELEKTYLLNK
ncbi:TlpA disulfide reductase family protein [Pedobacter alpinus]|uniref:TlpA disulfide reductase family protein n=1 Tax=Pedobacter alpinus TaxID=1590643 RepID=A0ABW5TVF7_9SPHI